MKIAGIVILVYGILTLAGGVYGYALKQSVISLIAGGASGIILIISALTVLKKNSAGLYVSIVISLVLAVHFGLNFSKAPKLMPAGLMLLLSLIAVGFAVYGLSQRE
jgi:uncharacterized membrane protein (UPF0136 family)